MATKDTRKPVKIAPRATKAKPALAVQPAAKIEDAKQAVRDLANLRLATAPVLAQELYVPQNPMLMEEGEVNGLLGRILRVGTALNELSTQVNSLVDHMEPVLLPDVGLGSNGGPNTEPSAKLVVSPAQLELQAIERGLESLSELVLSINRRIDL